MTFIIYVFFYVFLYMIVIFDLGGGLTDKIAHVNAIFLYTQKHNLNFTIRYSMFRTLDNPLKTHNNGNPFDLFDEKTFIKNPLYVRYADIKNKITKTNFYNFINIHKINTINDAQRIEIFEKLPSIVNNMPNIEFVYGDAYLFLHIRSKKINTNLYDFIYPLFKS